MDNKGMIKTTRNLGKHLRSHCDKILDKTVPFVIDSALLWFITEAIRAFSSNDATLYPDPSDEFHEIITFLSDFFEQSPTLCITLSDAIKGINSIPGNLDLVYFRSIEFLELRKIPPHMVASLPSVKQKLRKLKCSRCIDSVNEILNAHSVPGNSSYRSVTQDLSTGLTAMTIWPELRELDLSFNRISSIGEDVIQLFELTPSIENLNFSRNKLQSLNDSFSKVLTTLRVLNLNYNHLKTFPPVPQNVKTLLISHNYISSLSATNFQALKNLEVLDLSGNMIADENYLDSLEVLHNLKMLGLGGNPVSFLDNYRITVCAKLNRYVVNRNFMLDNIKLSVSEVRRALAVPKNLKFVPFEVENEPEVETSRVMLATPHCSTVNSLTMSFESTSSSLRSSCRKKAKIREPHVFDPDEDIDEKENKEEENQQVSVASKTDGSSGNELDEKSEVAAVTKNAIQYLREKYGEENWLLKQAGEEVGKMLGIQISTNVKSPLLVSQSLQSTKSFYTTAIEFDDSKFLTPKTPKPLVEPGLDAKVNDDEDETSIQSNVDSSLYYPCSAGPIPEDTDQSFTSATTTDVSLTEDDLIEDPFTIVDPDKKAKEFSYFQAGRKYVLMILDNYLYEMNPDKSSSYVTKWDLKSLETVADEKLNSETETVEFKVSFDTIKKNLRERTFVMPKSDYDKFCDAVSPYLELITMKEFAEAFQCLKCHAQFSKGMAEKAVRTDAEGIAREVPVCNNPECKSHLIVLLDSAPMPNDEIFNSADNVYASMEDSISGQGALPKPIADLSLFRVPLARSTPTELGSSESPQETNEFLDQHVRKFDQTNRLYHTRKSSVPESTNPNAHAKSGSDVDTLSAHSSSIEVLGAQCSSESGSDIAEVPEAFEVPLNGSEEPAAKTSGPVAMTDSTSSGSCADSICTTYEVKGETLKESTGNRFSTSISSTVSDSSTITLVSPNPNNISLRRTAEIVTPVHYDYESFATVDHRLQLFCEIRVFKAADEALVALTKVFVISESSQFHALAIFSNKKVYIYKIVGIEGDKPESWLQKHHSYSMEKILGINVLIGRHGIGMDIQGKYYALLFRDAQRTENFIACYLEKISCNSELPPLVRDFSQTHKAFLSPNSPVVYFGIPHYIECDEEKSQASAILITDIEMIYINDLLWLGTTRTGTVKASKVQLITNLRQVESFESNDRLVRLIFGATAHSFWSLYFETGTEKRTFCTCLEPYTVKVPFISLSQPIEP